MKTNLIEIQTYLKDKNICLLGNARSILNNKKNIDQYEIVGRINHGLPKGKELYIGSKTDIVFTSTNLSNHEVLQFHTKYVVWITKKAKIPVNGWQQGAIQNPPEDWQELKNQYPENKLPSTGLITVNFLLKHIDFKTLTIYGFDHFLQSGTWYHNLKNQTWHLGEVEKKIMEHMISNHHNVKIIYE